MAKNGCRWLCLSIIAAPILIIGILIGVYYPKAPRVSVTSEVINNFQVDRIDFLLEADLTVTVEIRNENVYPLTLDPMNITIAFPEDPNTIIATGYMSPGTIPKQGSAIRGVNLNFAASFATLGFSFLQDLRTGTTDLLLRGKARGVAPFLAQRSRFVSDLHCTITYYWDSSETSHNCKEKYSVALK